MIWSQFRFESLAPVSVSHTGFYRRDEDPGVTEDQFEWYFHTAFISDRLFATEFLRLLKLDKYRRWFLLVWISSMNFETTRRDSQEIGQACEVSAGSIYPVNCKIWIRLKTDPYAAGHLLRFESSHANWYDLVPGCCFNTNFITLPATLASIKHKSLFIFSNFFNELTKSSHFVLVNCFKMLGLKIEVMLDIYLKWTW